jgi:hypothetical protein
LRFLSNMDESGDGRRHSTSIESRVVYIMTDKHAYENRIEILQGTLDMLILQFLQRGPMHSYGIAQMIRSKTSDVLQIETGSLSILPYTGSSDSGGLNRNGASLVVNSAPRRACKVVGRLCGCGFFPWSGNRSKAAMPKAECIFEGSVKYVNADIKKALDGVPVPPHLLFLRHALCDDLVDCGLGEAGRDSGSRAIAFAVVRHGIGVRFEVSNHVKQRFAQLLQGWKVVETRACKVVG